LRLWWRRLRSLQGRLLLYAVGVPLAALGFTVFYHELGAEPAAAMAAASVAFGFISSLIAARRLYFLAGAAPHAALLAATLAVPLAFTFGGNPYWYAMPISIALVYIAGYMIFRGVEPDIATSILVSFSASASVLAVYYVKTSYPVAFDVSAVVFGDPLLVTRSETVLALATAAAVAALVLATYVENVYLGVDRDLAIVTGLRVWLYDLAFFTLLGLTVAVMVKVVGFILEHVFALLPGAAVALGSRSSKGALVDSLVLSYTAMGLGAGLSVATGLAPSGSAGIVMLLLYLIIAAWRR
jgi:zinc/manganese transport system permease protein